MTNILSRRWGAIRCLGSPFLALILIVIFSLSARAEEPITRAFGQVLGQAFDPNQAKKTVLSEHYLLFWYALDDQVPDLNEFYVAASPLTFRIYAIFAVGTPHDTPCLTAARGYFSVIAKKYEGEQYGGKMLASKEELQNDVGYQLTQSKTGRSIQVGCTAGELSLRYKDDALQQTALAEQRELNQIHADFEAARYDKILPRVRELSEQGSPWAQTMMALLYRRGGVAHDDEKAEEYYLRGAQRGWMPAEYNLGTFYRTQFRYKQAEIWLLKAANQEYPEAEENLAHLYLDKSPLQSEDKAFKWFLRAAEHGRPESQYNTCFDYADGLGVARDMVEAYKWCYIAAHNGQLQAGPNKDHLAKQMRPEEVARGREAAERWLAQHDRSK